MFYIRTNAENEIIWVYRAGAELPQDGDIEIEGDYLSPDLTLTTSDGIYKLLYIDGVITERIPEEIEIIRANLPPQPPTAEERLEALELAMLEVVLGGAE